MNSDGTSHALSEAEAVNRDLALSLNRDVEIEGKDLGPDGSLEVALGNRWFLSEDDAWRLGALGLVSYDNVWRNRERVQRSVTDPVALVETTNRTINAVSTTGVINLGLAYTDDHEITTSTTYIRNTDDEAAISTRTTNNFQISDGTQLRDYDIRYEQRELLVNQVRGHHVIGLDTRQSREFLDRDWLDGLTFDWYVSEAKADTDIPNEIKYSAEDRVDPTTGEVLSTAIRRSASAGDFRFTYLDDEVRSSGWDLLKPFAFENNIQVDLSTGQDISDKARTYTQTQFQLGTTATAAAPILVRHTGYRLHRRERQQSALSLRLVGGRHRHGELPRGANERGYLRQGRRARPRPLALRGRASLGGIPAGLAADRHSGVRRHRRPVRARSVRRGGAPEHHVRRGRRLPGARDDAHLPRRLGRGLPDPRRLERHGRAPGSTRDLGLELHRSR